MNKHHIAHYSIAAVLAFALAVMGWLMKGEKSDIDAIGQDNGHIGFAPIEKVIK